MEHRKTLHDNAEFRLPHRRHLPDRGRTAQDLPQMRRGRPGDGLGLRSPRLPRGPGQGGGQRHGQIRAALPGQEIPQGPARVFSASATRPTCAGCERQCADAGDISGPFWALMSHPSAPDALLRDVYGEVHMLSHRGGRGQSGRPDPAGRPAGAPGRHDRRPGGQSDRHAPGRGRVEEPLPPGHGGTGPGTRPPAARPNANASPCARPSKARPWPRWPGTATSPATSCARFRPAWNPPRPRPAARPWPWNALHADLARTSRELARPGSRGDRPGGLPVLGPGRRRRRPHRPCRTPPAGTGRSRRQLPPRRPGARRLRRRLRPGLPLPPDPPPPGPGRGCRASACSTWAAAAPWSRATSFWPRNSAANCSTTTAGREQSAHRLWELLGAADAVVCVRWTASATRPVPWSSRPARAASNRSSWPVPRACPAWPGP